jgi:hypothetical protein
MTDHHDLPDDPLPYDDFGTWDHLPHHDPADGLPDPDDEPADPAEPLFDQSAAHYPDDIQPEATPPPTDLPAEIPEMSVDGVAVDVFPPAVDVGELPEPVDGFPWTDPASLGPDGDDADADEPVQAAELAEYAAADLPPGADPWATLAGSDDPATAALARWWSQS